MNNLNRYLFLYPLKCSLLNFMRIKADTSFEHICNSAPHMDGNYDESVTGHTNGVFKLIEHKIPCSYER